MIIITWMNFMLQRFKARNTNAFEISSYYSIPHLCSDVTLFWEHQPPAQESCPATLLTSSRLLGNVSAAMKACNYTINVVHAAKKTHTV